MASARRTGIAAHRIMPRQGVWNAPSSRRQNHLTEIIEIFCPNVSSNCSDETILPSDETIFRFRADIRKQPLVIQLPAKRRTAPRPEPETANADDQLHPGFCLHPGRALDSWFFRRQPAGHRHLLLPRLPCPPPPPP